VLVLKDRVQDATWLSSEEKSTLAGRITEHNRHSTDSTSLLHAIKTPGFARLGFVYFLIQVASYGLNFWAPQLVRTSGIVNPTTIGLYTAVPYIAGAICMIVVGRLSDASGERRGFVSVLMVFAALGLLGAGMFAKDTGFLVLALGLLGGGVVAAVPAFWALPPKLLTGAGAAGGIALINTIGQLGGIVSPVMVGHIRDLTGSATPALYLISAMSLACAFILHFGLPDSLRRKDDS